MHIDLKLLSYAQALAEHESFSVAARELGISQPALSRAIQRLEASVGTRLFVRSRKAIVPTGAGELMLTRARELLAEADRLKSDMGRLKSMDRPSYLVGCGPFASRMVIGMSAGYLLRDLPDVGLVLSIDQPPALTRQVRRRELDLAIAEGSVREFQDEVEYEDLPSVPGYAVVRAGHPLLDLASPGLPEILSYPFVMSGKMPARILNPLLESLPGAGREANPNKAFPAVDCPAPDTIIDIVACSDAVGFTTLAIGETALRSGRIVALEFRPPWLQTAFAIIRYRDQRPSEVQDRVVKAIRRANDEVIDHHRRVARELFGE